MSRTWRYAAGIFAALTIIGSAIAVTVVVATHSGSDAVDAQIEASIDADSARESTALARSAAAETAAATTCEGLVRDQLKAPATAQFTIMSNDVGAPTGAAQGIVHGAVDSQNSYGALVRSDWTCMVLPGSTVDAMKVSITSLVQR